MLQSAQATSGLASGSIVPLASLVTKACVYLPMPPGSDTTNSGDALVESDIHDGFESSPH